MRKAGVQVARMALVAMAMGLGPSVSSETVLPQPAPPFAGKIGETYADSVPAFPKPVTAPAGAPNVLLIMTDDVGFAAASTFGGPVPTPNLTRLAERGLVFNRFHTTAMCSPTRAALLTGRNHHAVDNGTVANLSTGFPGYDNLMPKSAATIAEVLRGNGYSTAMFGKHHNTPEPQVSPAGPFDLWPTGLGFDYFYGFMAAEANQFTPGLYRNTTPIPTLKKGVLDKALADEAIHWIHTQKAAAPDKPFFVYYATGSTHNPLQAPADWIARFRGKFDRGYDAVRAETVKRQLAMGIIPPGTVNTPRPDGITPWTDLTPDQKRVNARMMEVYAAMLAYQDAQIGRVLDELDRMGQSDRTLVIFIEGDNGAAAEADRDGSTNPMAGFANGFQESIGDLVKRIDSFGGPDSVGGYGFGWAWAMNAPFQWFKQYASHFGGTRNGMVVSWPDHITARGIRSQFTDVTDVVPTILDLTGIAAPDVVGGVRQQAMDGVSFAYSFDAPKAPERHRTQYFEMMGNRAIYHDGWVAATTPVNRPWAMAGGKMLPSDYAWELYDTRSDFSESRNLAARNPAKLAEMQTLFHKEALRNHVYPLDDRLTIDRMRASMALQPRYDHYTFWGGDLSLPMASTVPLFDRGFRITANVTLDEEHGTGPLMALGGKFAGWSFYLKDGRPMACIAVSQWPGDQWTIAASAPLPAGKAVLTYDFRYDGGINAGGELVISANGREMARGRIGRSLSKLVEQTDKLDIGLDSDTPVTGDYPAGSRFPGDISRLDVDLGKVGMQGGAMPPPGGSASR